MRVEFECQRCGKRLRLEPRVYTAAYAGQQLCLSCRAEDSNSGRPTNASETAATPNR